MFGFDFKHFKGDLFGGITAGIVALPLALAFGLQSGLGAIAGFYGAIFISFFAALFGGTNTQISGPTAPMTAVSMVIVGGILAANNNNHEVAVPIILMVFLLAGLLQIVFGVLKIGQYIKYIPYPVVSGFMSGIGFIILFTQIPFLFGYYAKDDVAYVETFKAKSEEVILNKILKAEAAEEILVLEDFEETIKRAAEITPEAINDGAASLAKSASSSVKGSIMIMGRAISNLGKNYMDLILGLLTIFIIFGFKRITTSIPSTLVALLVVSLGAFFLLPEYRTIGKIPSGFPKLRLDIFTGFDFMQILPYLLTAISLAGLGVIDSLLTSIVADNMTKTKHKPNQELIGQGIGNSIAALFGGLPGAGATIRTVVNINSGGKTKLSGMIAGVLLLFILLSLGPLASKIPAAVLAGILITVGIGVLDYKGLKHMGKLPKSEVIVMLIVLLLTVFWGLIEAVGIGLVLSCLLFMKKTADIVDDRSNSAPLAAFEKELPWEDEGELVNKVGEKIYIKHMDGPLFFGFSSRFTDLVNNLPSIRVVIFRMGKVPYVDQSGLYAMEDAIIDLQKQGIKVVFTNLQEQPKEIFDIFGLAPGLVGEEDCFVSFEECATWLEGYLKSEPFRETVE